MVKRKLAVGKLRAMSCRRNTRPGAAIAELTLCLPIIGVLTFGTIEACSMIFLKQSLEIAAYEGGRTALRPGATSSEVIADCQQVMTDRGITGAGFVLTPTDILTAPVNSFLNIQVTAPCSSNLMGGEWFFGGRTVVGEVEVMKEF